MILSTLVDILVWFTSITLENFTESITQNSASSESVKVVCEKLAGVLSPASSVYDAFTLEWIADIEHWAASSTQESTCSVEPGSISDVGLLLQTLGSTGTPFAVKGGGHTANPGFSSTTGVQIAMSRFNEVVYNKDANTVDIGAGLIWDDVYEALAPYGVNVVGGRVSGVGVAGFILGGGLSFLTNQYGLTIDTVQSFELVLTNGTALLVTEAAYPDLFFALKGGLNNYGIVTKFTLSAYPQGQVWGGLITLLETEIPALIKAITNFATNYSDTKAAILPTINYLLGEPGVSLILFYDEPTPPADLFEDFLNIPYFTKNIETRTFLDLVRSSPSNATEETRGYFHTVTLESYSESILNAIFNETKYWGERLSLLDSAVFVSYDVEPFLPSLYSHGSASAYPPDRSRGLVPLNIYYAFLLQGADASIQNALKESAATIKNVAISEGQDVADAAIYGNYALFDTPLQDIYGANLPRLKAIKAEYDPNNVMGLAGGFKF